MRGSSGNQSDFTKLDLNNHVYGNAQNLNEWLARGAKMLSIPVAELERMIWINTLERMLTEKIIRQKDEKEMKRLRDKQMK
jgi:hypothetical protein